ncbi:hypothetical protein [Clostridium magnum]|uniref:Uncharacterized protein n=1 Tax=Clostridium magnum DSM 2767 TaxID=1121326 RepID=A0A162UXE1_9CLOT|nr:hypothetical protein [Clostridium magnum]KZL94383.1 hypothetical protein CLMAG_14360 [Clostridium magnum DSM 2767]SHJ59560.1 hypothetical protein SAMN02745944_06207 [Clostridium magnum DSM 2767]
MAVNPRFQVRDTEEELKKLDEALKILNYSDRAAWYKEMKRRTIIEAEKKKAK